MAALRFLEQREESRSRRRYSLMFVAMTVRTAVRGWIALTFP